ncbi:cytochrome b/b6 domain-containing protein [Maritimibacter sp. UBA3975]|uniref:cytochrome b n=1 Tax=Maritimibacter sp. UBA3975 TaxID=1946833 RepID=UPI0025B7A7A4|nr:cytochrome b/b6 domain-containing protein [Maritimibacter sp. UBA3975]|tara:strand:- start:3549 stop:4034 length:486 start_codon:yes stop_codon:yes gene_type:complete
MPNGYTRLQIALHWVIFLLIAAQFLFHDGIQAAWRAVIRGTDATFSVMAAQHIFTGLLVLALVVLRLAIKLRRGAPAMPAEEPEILKLTARVTHWLLYGFMILVPVSGAAAWFAVNENAAQGHELFKSILLLLIALHFLGALFQRFVLKSDVMTRMMRPNA